MSKRTSRCFSRTFVLIVAVLFVGAGVALAQGHTTGVSITKTCDAVVTQGVPYTCNYALQNQDPDHGVINLAVFDSHPPVLCPSTQTTACAGEVQVACTGGLTATSLAKKNDVGDTCTGTLGPFTAEITCSDFQDIDTVRAVGTDAVVTTLTITGSTQNGPLASITCEADTNECTNDVCTPGVGCEHPPVENSTACGDTDANNCTTAGCEAGVCVQAHVTTPCVALECNTAACNADHVCVQTPVEDSTACTDTDADNCTTAGCEAGSCVQAHVTTPCTPENECHTAACDETHTCVQTAKEDSTTCTDTGDVCFNAGCEAGQCVQTHTPSGDPSCESELICRTPGFWGTRGGTEKTSSEPTTCDVLANFGGSLVICGEPITNCDLCSDRSVLEAICVSPKGDSSLQLARQLTAAALNCAVTKTTDAEGACVPTAIDGANPCSGLGTIENLFQACNGACPGSLSGGDEIACIGLLDCFNNGFAIEFDEGTNTFSCGELTGCHEKDSGCFDQTPPKPAGSSRECNDSRKDCVSIFGTIEGCTEEICID